MTRPSRLTDGQRQTIFYVEALALLHDMGKLTAPFIGHESTEKIPDQYAIRMVVDPRRSLRPKIPLFSRLRGFLGIASKPAPSPAAETLRRWHDVATNPGVIKPFNVVDWTEAFTKLSFGAWEDDQYSFAELLPAITQSPNTRNADWRSIIGKSLAPAFLIGILHGAAHYERSGNGDKQSIDNTRVASPFGFEASSVDGSALDRLYRDLPLDKLSNITNRAQWLKPLRTTLSASLGDTRRPYNEVSLWDWGYVVSCLVKPITYAILAQNALNPRNTDPIGAMKTYQLQPVRVNVDRLGLYARASKITDLLGLKAVLDEAYEATQNLIEERYAIANRFYHDETGAYYLFPTIDDLSEIQDAIAALFPADLQPFVAADPLHTVSPADLDRKEIAQISKLVALPRQSAVDDFREQGPTTIDPAPIATSWQDQRPDNAETCTACGLRPVGHRTPTTEYPAWVNQDKARTRKICCECLFRRGRRAQTWLTTEGFAQTIWTDEVADTNGRFALIVAKLDLTGWLEGGLVTTLGESSASGKTRGRKNGKLPSPARLYRMAETARQFWEDVVTQGLPSSVQASLPRIALEPDEDTKRLIQELERQHRSLGDYHAYELNIDGVDLNVVWDPQFQRLISAENLAYFVTRWRPQALDAASELGTLKGNTYHVREASGFLSPGKEIIPFKIDDVALLSTYTPCIPLLTEAGLFLAMVPAADALKVAQSISAAYATEFGRVRDRLPLHIGLVFSPRRTPMSAVLDAGRRMLDMAPSWDWEPWEVKATQETNQVNDSPLNDIGKSPPHSTRTITFSNDISWNFPRLTADPAVPDRWYPYLIRKTEPASPTDPPESLTHVDDLISRNPKIPDSARYSGATVYVRPSRFDFVFLDTTTRRFELAYSDQGSRIRRSTRPYYLDDLDRFQRIWNALQYLSVSQRYQVVRTIESTRELWGEPIGQPPNALSQSATFREFVSNTFAGAAWHGKNRWRNFNPILQQELITAGVYGELADILELYMSILKLDLSTSSPPGVPRTVKPASPSVNTQGA